MMPDRHETSTKETSSNVLLANRIEKFYVHAEPHFLSSSVEAQSSDHKKKSDRKQELATSRFSSILRESLRPIVLKFEDVSYSIKLEKTKGNCLSSSEPKQWRTVLSGVTGIVKAGEIMAMLGPSGSGKTTLLTALAGRLHGRVSGVITYNGQCFSSSIKRKVGFVTQDDMLYPHLTVVETLIYAALLRLPKELTREEKVEQAELIITELGLTRCRNSVVGGPLFRGVSGGERKRVSIGQEMLVNPSLLLLDEPTSGLDSTTAQRIVAILRGLARGGRTVITTIHQPSSRLYRMFDKVVVLSEGYPIYSGNAEKSMEYFGLLGFVPGFNLVNPADFLLDLANGVTPDTKHEYTENYDKLDHCDDQTLTKQSLISSYKKILLPVMKVELCGTMVSVQSSARSSSSSNEDQWSTSWCMQFRVLLERGLKERKHESYSGLRIFQVISVSILSGLLWWHSDTSHLQDQVGLLFFFSIFWGFFPLNNAIFAFPQERPMLTRERSSGMYRLSSYYFARMAGDMPMELLLPTIFVTITYWMGGLKPSLITFLLTLSIILFNVLVSQGLGQALGAILVDLKQATTLASVTMLVFLLAGGYYIQHIPWFISWIKYISFSHYCYKLLVGVQYSDNEVYKCGLGVHCKVWDFPAIKYLGVDNMVWDVLALSVMFVGYRILAYVALRMK